ncbi:hypothetical protein ST41_02175 [Prevotella pectinovora]|nr:hypothetical protein ST41_02175 [Prevotella pectinovora]
MTNYSANEHQPPLGLPRRITHPNLPQGKEQVTLPMNFSPLSVSPVGEMQVTPLRQRLGDAGYSAPAEIGRCRLLRFGRDWEMQATPLRQRLGDAGYSALAEIGRCRNRCRATDSHDRKGKPKVTKQQQKKTG